MTTKRITTLSCEDFVEILAGNNPVPGGGGASALAGAIGTALGNMVGSLTVGKKKYADVEDDIFALNEGAKAYLKSVNPLKRLGQPGDIDGAALLLASDAGRYITGTVITIDGGQSLTG